MFPTPLERPRRARLRRWAFTLALSGWVVAGAAQSPPPPPDLEPLPEPPPPPPGAIDPTLEPQVTITRREGDVYEETRIGGRVVSVKVTPRVGPPYYLIDDVGDGRFTRRESHESGLRVPQWVLFSF